MQESSLLRYQAICDFLKTMQNHNKILLSIAELEHFHVRVGVKKIDKIFFAIFSAEVL